MPASPCSFRSAQCAALIALAAAAGISRMEAPEAAADAAGAGRPLTLQEADSPVSVWRGLVWAAADSRVPWMREIFDVALRIAGFRSAKGGESDPSPFLKAAPPWPANPVAPVSPYDVATRVSPYPANDAILPLSRRPHALAFAVGPPAGATDLHPLAVGTEVPGDFAANGMFAGGIAAPDEASSLARLARRFDPRPEPAGSPIESGSRGIHWPALAASARWSVGPIGSAPTSS